MSSISGVFGLATVVGPLLGGFFTDYISWRWIFYINLPFGVITFGVCWVVLRKIQNAQRELPVDILGSALVFSATCGLVLLVTWGGVNYAWDSWVILFLIVMSVIFFFGFIFQELRHPQPILNLRLFRIHNFAVTCIVMLFFGMSMFGGFSFVPVYFQDVRGDSAIVSGLKLIPMLGGMVISSIVTGLYISKTGKFLAFPILGMAFLAIGEGVMSLMNETMSYGIEWIFLFVMGTGMGMCFPVFNSIVQNSVPPQDMASSIAGVTFIRSIGGSIGVSINGSILNQKTTQYTKQYHGNVRLAETKALDLIFLAAMAPALLGFVLTFLIRKSDIFTRKPGEGTHAPAVEM